MASCLFREQSGRAPMRAVAVQRRAGLAPAAGRAAPVTATCAVARLRTLGPP